MKIRQLLLLGLLSLAVLSALALGGCLSTERIAHPAAFTGNELTISTGTQGTAGGHLFIGLGDTGKQNYTDNATGKSRTRLAAWLYLHIDGNPPIDQRQQVFAGDTVNFQGYSLYVEQISAGGIGCAPGASTGDVHLIVRQP